MFECRSCHKHRSDELKKRCTACGRRTCVDCSFQRHRQSFCDDRCYKAWFFMAGDDEETATG